ncbi:MAG TPA: M1 family metallopeptidase [Kofleriaceae bacterium]|nr:M1 family metallopeptidase [Kofleriaceae bacterium]
MARRDPHSYNDDTQPETEELALTATVDFATHTLAAEATLTFRAPAAGGPLDLDTRDLTIESVVDAAGAALAHTLHRPEPILGARLTVELPPGATSIRIRYRTSPEASALQWLEPGQTLGGRQPFLFSQCQALHARSLVPLQDTPRVRIRYTAELTVPRALTAVMAAAHLGRTEDAAGDVAVERWEMPQPIPPYLFAFAVGELASHDLSPRCRVWAEPAQLAAAAYEFAEVESMIEAAEALFGPYEWDRFDILTMPPSFPYGGMENPRLTFITPTVIAGDRSLVNVLAHELAHSWTGNLVTNANAEHFWLNEGFTVYAERRILEAREGTEAAALSAALGRRELERTLARFAEHPELTRLRTRLDGVDPDEAYSLVPYEKGYFFLAAIEAWAGRASFDEWLRGWLQMYRFGAATTEDFEAHLEWRLPGALAAVDGKAWLDGPGLPASAPPPRSERLDAIERVVGTVPDEETTESWSPTEWQIFLESTPRPAPLETCRALDERFALTARGNHDVLVAWLTLALESGDHAVLPRVEEVLTTVGRMKYLRPLYTALVRDPRTRDLAAATYARARAGYHPIARQLVEGLLRTAGKA